MSSVGFSSAPVGGYDVVVPGVNDGTESAEVVETAKPEDNAPEEVGRIGGIDGSVLNDLGTDEEVQEQVKVQSGQTEPRTAKQSEFDEILAKRDQAYAARLNAIEQAYSQQAQRTEQFLNQQIELQRQQMQFMQANQQKQVDAVDESKLTDVEKFERSILAKAKNLSSAELNELKAEIAAERQGRQQAYEQAQTRQRVEAYSQGAQKAAASLFGEGVNPADVKKLENEMSEMLLTYSASVGVTPDKAASRFKQMLDQYHLARLNVKAKGGSSIQAGQRVPKTVAIGKQSANGESWPDMSALYKAGFKNHVQWIAKGSPSLAKH